MEEEMLKAAHEYNKKFRRISPSLFMRKFKITYNYSLKMCCKIWLHNHLEARKLAKDLEIS